MMNTQLVASPVASVHDGHLSQADSVTQIDAVAASASRSARLSRVTVVLPAYNEEANLSSLLSRIDLAMGDAGLSYRVIVVDDGSTDHTSRILDQVKDQLPISVLRHSSNQGLGATIRDGLRLSVLDASPSDIVVTMDSDETHTPGLIPGMVRMIHEGHDVVIASRFQPGARVVGLTMFRRFVSWSASWLMRIMFPTVGVHDYTCGFRAYRACVLQEAFTTYGAGFVDQQGFQCMVDILLKLRRRPLIFGELPMILRYDWKRGNSKMPVFRTIRNTVILLLRRRIGR